MNFDLICVTTAPCYSNGNQSHCAVLADIYRKENSGEGEEGWQNALKIPLSTNALFGNAPRLILIFCQKSKGSKSSLLFEIILS